VPIPADVHFPGENWNPKRKAGPLLSLGRYMSGPLGMLM
jgi:hypothetical protein